MVYIDADERIEFDWTQLNNNIDAVKMKLFDFYITKNDIDKKYSERKYLGPEYRKIIMAFRVGNTIGYFHNDQRECELKKNSKILEDGFVKHYGKAISIEEWETTCDYYSKYFPISYQKKWLNRKGKAIHEVSDFGLKLIEWKDIKKKGIDMNIAKKINKNKK